MTNTPWQAFRQSMLALGRLHSTAPPVHFAMPDVHGCQLRESIGAWQLHHEDSTALGELQALVGTPAWESRLLRSRPAQLALLSATQTWCACSAYLESLAWMPSLEAIYKIAGYSSRLYPTFCMHACMKPGLRLRSHTALKLTTAGLADCTATGAMLLVECKSNMQDPVFFVKSLQ